MKTCPLGIRRMNQKGMAGLKVAAKRVVDMCYPEGIWTGWMNLMYDPVYQEALAALYRKVHLKGVME